MRQHIADAAEEIDAAIFTGDLLHSDDERTELNAYATSWQRAIAAYEDNPSQIPNQVATLERTIQALVTERDKLKADNTVLSEAVGAYAEVIAVGAEKGWTCADLKLALSMAGLKLKGETK